MQNRTTKLPKLPKGLSWRKYASGNVAIQVSFTYRGIPCREVLQLSNTKNDIAYATHLLGEIKSKIVREIFKYADYFPHSKMLEKLGETRINIHATLGDYIDKYVEDSRHIGKSKDTIKKYTNSKKGLGKLIHTKVLDIDALWLTNLFKNDPRSHGTLKILKSVISNALNIAKLEKLISANPCPDIKLNELVNTEQRVYNTCHEIDPFTIEEVERILRGAYKMSDQIGHLIQLWLNTGLRTQEILGLTWEHVDFKNKELHVALGMVDGELKPKLKNKLAKRTIPLNEAALEALQKQKPLTYFKQGLVFIHEHPKAFTHADKFKAKIWAPLLHKVDVNVRYRRPYNCRHTFATMHISSKNYVNIWKLCKWMGHGSPTMIEKHYGDFKEAYESLDSQQGLTLETIQFARVQNACNL